MSKKYNTEIKLFDKLDLIAIVGFMWIAAMFYGMLTWGDLQVAHSAQEIAKLQDRLPQSNTLMNFELRQ